MIRISSILQTTFETEFSRKKFLYDGTHAVCARNLLNYQGGLNRTTILWSLFEKKHGW